MIGNIVTNRTTDITIAIKAWPGNIVIELKTFATEIALLNIPGGAGGDGDGGAGGEVMIMKRLILKTSRISQYPWWWPGLMVSMILLTGMMDMITKTSSDEE